VAFIPPPVDGPDLRAVWWARATANGLPAHELEAYMTAHFADMDAHDSDERTHADEADELVNRWRQYGS
jgi:hypothetical protein